MLNCQGRDASGISIMMLAGFACCNKLQVGQCKTRLIMSCMLICFQHEQYSYLGRVSLLSSLGSIPVSTCIISTARTHPLTLNENQDLHMIGILCKILDFIPLNVKSEDQNNHQHRLKGKKGKEGSINLLAQVAQTIHQLSYYGIPK